MMIQGEQAFTLFSPVDEDCLYANIWMPAAPPAPPMPVMVFFYGGSDGAVHRCAPPSEILLRTDDEMSRKRRGISVTASVLIMKYSCRCVTTWWRFCPWGRRGWTG